LRSLTSAPSLSCLSDDDPKACFKIDFVEKANPSGGAQIVVFVQDAGERAAPIGVVVAPHLPNYPAVRVKTKHVSDAIGYREFFVLAKRVQQNDTTAIIEFDAFPYLSEVNRVAHSPMLIL
jgi:hypothetical protein